MKPSAAPKKILIVCSHFWPSIGGLESRMGQFSTELLKAGYAVTVLTGAMAQRTSTDYHGVTIVGVDQGQFSAAIRTAVGSGAFDTCILIQDPLGNIIWSIEDLPIPPQTRVLIQPIINEDGYSRWKDNPDFSGRLAKILKAASVALVMTRTGPDTRFMRSAGIPHVYLPNATTQVAAAGDFRAQFDIAPDKFLILHVANLYWVKNHVGLIDALPNLPPSWQLVMIGNTSGEPDCVQAVQGRLATRPDIRFIPGLSREWVAAAMQAADVVVLASKGEGSPITILEAMSHRKPWLATPECGAANDHVGGFICALDSFNAHLRVLANDRDLRASLGRISYAHWEQCYSWPVAIRGWVDLIEQGKLGRPFELEQPLRNQMQIARDTMAAALSTQAGHAGSGASAVDFTIFHVASYRSGPIRFGWSGDVNTVEVQEILIPALGDEYEVSIADTDLPPAQMAEFYNAIDVLLVCSTAPAAAGCLPAAMACGVFPVAVDGGNNARYIAHASQGILAAGSAAAFRDAMQWCVEHSDEVRKTGYRNAQWVAQASSGRSL